VVIVKFWYEWWWYACLLKEVQVQVHQSYTDYAAGTSDTGHRLRQNLVDTSR
jgi:hypothetical protein